MKIQNNGPENINRAQLESANQVEGARSANAQRAEAQPKPARDELALSDKARLLGKARTEMNVLPDIRQERVEPLKQAISAGTYKIQYQALASRLLGEA